MVLDHGIHNSHHLRHRRLAARRRQRHAPLEALADAGPHPATALEEKEKALYGRQVLGEEMEK